jgi:lipid-A-disaccharide synthase
MSQNNPRLYIIAGEASGDLHGSNLLAALKEINPAIETRCWGGDLMKKEGATIVKHISELAFMGFVEVLFNLRTIIKNIDFCKKDILEFKPDILVLIDYPGFNLRIADWAKQNNICVHYYISPQVWAWKQSRVGIIKRCVDKMYTILPFENSFYEKFDYSTEYVGHPLLDEIEKHAQHSIDKTEFLSKNKLSDLPIIALLPGSRKQEIHVKLPIMLAAVKDLKTYQIIIAGAPNQSLDMYQAFESLGVTIIFDQTYNLLSFSELAVVTSGTATLETALFSVPQVVCYKGSFISYIIARNLIKIKYISLVNLIMDKLVVKELIQQDCTSDNIRKELRLLIENQEYRHQMITNYGEMRLLLGQGGASQKVANSLLKTISKA